MLSSGPQRITRFYLGLQSRILPKYAGPFMLRYGFAAASIGLATWVRLLLDPLLGLQVPFATLFLAIMLTAWYGGFGPALLAALLGALCSLYLLSPRGAFFQEGHDQWVSMLLYLGTGLGIACLGGMMKAAERRAEELRLVNDVLETRRRQRIEERLRQTVESAPNGMVISDHDGKIVLVNAQMEKLFGYNRDELLGQTVEMLVPERFRTAHGYFRKEYLADPDTRPMGAGRDLHGLRKDGSEFPVEIGLNPIENDESRVVLSTIVDITERKRAEVALRRLNDELEQGIQRLSKANHELESKTQESESFVYSVSHDLRSPLVNLLGFSKELSRAMQSLRAVLEESDLPQQFRDRELAILDGPMAKAIHFIQTAVTRLSSSIDALLRLSRAGRVVYQRQYVDVQATVTRIVESLRGTAEERGAMIQTGDLPAALGDPAALEQIFANLIGNALNYLDRNRPGRIEVGSLEPEQDDAGAGLRTYYVRDNGLGISEAGRARIFQPFQRLNPQAAPGEGIGLAIVHRVVERHGGRIWFESVAAQGSTFFVALPTLPHEESPASLFQPACSSTGIQPR